MHKSFLESRKQSRERSRAHETGTYQLYYVAKTVCHCQTQNLLLLQVSRFNNTAHQDNARLVFSNDGGDHKGGPSGLSLGNRFPAPHSAADRVIVALVFRCFLARRISTQDALVGHFQRKQWSRCVPLRGAVDFRSVGPARLVHPLKALQCCICRAKPSQPLSDGHHLPSHTAGNSEEPISLPSRIRTIMHWLADEWRRATTVLAVIGTRTDHEPT